MTDWIQRIVFEWNNDKIVNDKIVNDKIIVDYW